VLAVSMAFVSFAHQFCPSVLPISFAHQFCPSVLPMSIALLDAES
jgi:hypothetical protein